MEIEALRKETATRSHLTHRRITDSSRMMLNALGRRLSLARPHNHSP